MDKWKYYDIRHKRHLLCNPMNKEKFEKLCRLLRLEQGSHVLDIACGKGEFLIRLAELYNISGVGVDLSPYCIRDCVAKHHKRRPDSDLRFIEMDGAKYRPKASELFDSTMCIGASWVYDGYRGTLKALKTMTKPGGLVVVGEAFWRNDPPEAYLKASGIKREDFGTHLGNVQVAEEEGLTCVYTMVSNSDDWDHYETLKWWNVEDYVRNNPNDEDIEALLERTRKEKDTYLRWERATLGWAIYVLKNMHKAGQR